MKNIPIFLSLLILLTGCISELLDMDKTSSGTCYAEPEMTTVIGVINPGGSYFFRDDQINLVEHAFVNISVSSSTTNDTLLVVDAHFRDMPSSGDEGTHLLLGPGYIDRWDVLVPANAVVLGDSFVIISASREYVRGVFTIEYQSQPSIICDVVLGRKYSLDTDDGNDPSVGGGSEIIDIIF